MTLTRHAAARARQRGVTDAAIRAVIAHADCEIPVGDGCTVLRVSHAACVTLGPVADRIRSLAVLLAGDGDVVSLIHDHGGRRGRRYRRAA